ncbi:3-oxoacyl-ACP synthase III family protein [Nocardia sp. NPDC004654]|uniref:3-oxoacyl-ACP synthase III family protein n=1 Tax=Nocardia sp. NPDC004654 TaxID=3154776 RepID=UPI0033A339F3
MTETGIYVLSTGTVLPGPAVDNATLAHYLNVPPLWQQWIDTFIGTDSRHFSVDLDTGERLYTLADLGSEAAARALSAAGVHASDIDLIVMGTSSPDNLMPATVNLVADRLGITAVPTYQLQSGCAGAVQALDVARQMLRTGRHRTALVIGADSCAKHMGLATNLASASPAEQINGVLFGDGAGAAVLTTLRPDPSANAAVLYPVLVRFAGLNQPPGQIIEWFGKAELHSDQPAAVEDYKAIEALVPSMAVNTLRDLLDELAWKEAEVDYILPPQLSGRMTARIMAEFGLPHAYEISCVKETGNTGNALPFFLIEGVLPRMAEGDRAVAVAIESSKWIESAFAIEKV